MIVTLKCLVFGLPLYLIVLIRFLPRNTVTRRSPARACTVIAKRRSLPACAHDVVGLEIVIEMRRSRSEGGGHGGV